MPSSALPHSLRSVPEGVTATPSSRTVFEPLPPEVANHPWLSAGRQNPRPLLAIAGDDPQDWGEPDWALGARPARMPLSIFTAIRAITAVAQDAFWVRMRAPAPMPRMRAGVAMAPWRERANIANRRGDAFGSTFVMDPAGTGFTSDVFAGVPGMGS